MDGADDVTQSDSTQGRRAFLKRMAAFTFAAPVISSFILDSDAFADGHGKNQYGQNQTQKVPPGQYGQNQTQKVPPGQYGQNQTHNPPPDHPKPPPGQYGQNQTHNPPPDQKPCPPPNQYGQNQTKVDKSPRHR